jgi:uncharacterized paraquat-inducible protein A
MFKRVRRCANCDAPLTYRDIRAAGPFPCPVCKTLLVASESYSLFTLLTSLSLSVLILVSLGFRGTRLFHALLLAFIPVVFLNANFFKYLILPSIEVYMPDTTLRLRR